MFQDISFPFWNQTLKRGIDLKFITENKKKGKRKIEEIREIFFI